MHAPAFFNQRINRFYRAICECKTFISLPSSLFLVPPFIVFLPILLTFSLLPLHSLFALEWRRIGEVIQEVGYNFNDGVSARADY